jgi:hypothetical protein
MSRYRGLLAGCLALGLLAAAAPGRCAEGGAAEQAARVARTAESLHRVPVEDMDTDVPAAARPLLSRLKQELRALVAARLATAGERPAAALRARLIADLRPAGARLDAKGRTRNEEPAHRYGDILELQVEEPPAHPGLLTVAITLGIMCGSDTSLYVFRREAARWQLVLAQESNGYATVAGAQNLYDYELSPPEPGGGFFMATVSISAWCTSNWQGIRLELLRPGASPDQPRVLLDELQSAFGEDYRLRVLGRDVVSLVFQGNESLDRDNVVREHVLRYKVAGDRVARIPPLARKPADFLDEWLDLPWPQAREWSAPGLEEWHARLQRQTASYSLKDPAVRTGAAGLPGRWWVQLCLDGKGLPAGLYFLISRRGDLYRLEEVRTRRPRRLSARDDSELCESGKQ